MWREACIHLNRWWKKWKIVWWLRMGGIFSTSADMELIQYGAFGQSGIAILKLFCRRALQAVGYLEQPLPNVPRNVSIVDPPTFDVKTLQVHLCKLLLLYCQPWNYRRLFFLGPTLNSLPEASEKSRVLYLPSFSLSFRFHLLDTLGPSNPTTIAVYSLQVHCETKDVDRNWHSSTVL